MTRILLSAVLVAAVASGCQHGGERYANAVDPCWPERYSHVARLETLQPFQSQAVNGHTLAHPTFVEGQDSFITRVISLPTPIPGPDYMVEFLETNQVPLGNGSVSLNINGPSYVVIGSA